MVTAAGGSSQQGESKRRSPVDRFLSGVEWAGNLLPHPVTLFALFALGTILLSGVGAWLDWSVVDPRPDGTKDKSADGLVHVVSLMDASGLRRITANLVQNFVQFAPLGTVLVALLGVGIAEHSGLISAAIRLLIFGAPRSLVTAALVFAGVLSNTASEVGYVVIVPLGAAIYYSMDRHPLAGLAAAFAGVSGGYSANLLLGTVDPLLAGITTPAAQMISPGYEVNPACNLYFMMASTFIVTFAGTWVSTRIIEPRLGPYDRTQGDAEFLAAPGLESLTPEERNGLKWSGLSIAVCSLFLVYLCWPVASESFTASWPWRGALSVPTSSTGKTPAFLEGIVAIIFVGFLIPGVVYGWRMGTIRNDKDIINSMSKSMTSMGTYIVLVFFAAQFVEYFKWTNLGTIIAVQGAEAIRGLSLDNAAVFVPFILICAAVNLLMGSASAKWTFMAPIFVPMLMLVGYSPEVIQAAYRIGDSCTNVISPMMSYFGMIFVFATRYDRKFGMGSIISLMLPYSVIFLIAWTAFFYVWVFLLGLPVGPNAATYLDGTV